VSHKILSIPEAESRELIQASRSSRVERFEQGGLPYFVKTYWYPGLRAPLRGAFRTTFLAPSRAQRERRALEHLALAGLQPALFVHLEEARRLGFLRRSVLVTAGFGDRNLSQQLEQAPLDEEELWLLGRFVRRLHESGLRDPDLKARNILLEGHGAELRIAKIDASSSWLRAPGPGWDRQRTAELGRFVKELSEAGVPRVAIGDLLAAIEPPPEVQSRIAPSLL